MKRHCPPMPSRQRGVSLIEVLITMVIVAFGLLGLAAFQAKAQVGSIESYQRAQAAVLLQDMQSRLSGNSAYANDYTTAVPLGTGDALYGDDCSLEAAGSARDKCEWSAALKGAAERRDGTLGGAMEGARGCITRVRLQNTATGVCTPAVYLITVAWQGLHATRAPAQACGRGEYGDETHRRAISARVAVGLPNCI